MGVTLSQFFPPHPTLTEQNLPSQKSKVFIVTGGTSGVGYHLATILYQSGGKVYIAGRTEAKAKQAIEEIKSLSPDDSSAGELENLTLELDDLSSIKASAEAFKAKESKLDVLWNNAGVSLPPVGSVSKQGH
jgi:NAD(P)-dependent dehydrogenase (short-subunit alcohol dehydrogenase family)